MSETEATIAGDLVVNQSLPAEFDASKTGDSGAARPAPVRRTCPLTGGILRSSGPGNLPPLCKLLIAAGTSHLGRVTAHREMMSALDRQDVRSVTRLLTGSICAGSGPVELFQHLLLMADLLGAALARTVLQHDQDALQRQAGTLLAAFDNLAQMRASSSEVKDALLARPSDEGYSHKTALTQALWLASDLEAAIVRTSMEGRSAREGEAAAAVDSFRYAMIKLSHQQIRPTLRGALRWRVGILLTGLLRPQDDKGHQDFVMDVCEALVAPVLSDGGESVHFGSTKKQLVLLALTVALHVTEPKAERDDEFDGLDATSEVARAHQLLDNLLPVLRSLELKNDGDTRALVGATLAVRAELARAELSRKSYRGVRNLPRDLVDLIDSFCKNINFVRYSDVYPPVFLKHLAPRDAILVPIKLLRLSEALASSKHPQAAVWPLVTALHLADGMPWADLVPRFCTRAMMALTRLTDLPLEGMGLPNIYREHIRWAADMGLEGAAQLQRGSIAQLIGQQACIRMQAEAFLLMAVPNTRPAAMIMYRRRLERARQMEAELQKRLQEEEEARQGGSSRQGEGGRKMPARVLRLRRQNRRENARACRAKAEGESSEMVNSTVEDSDDDEEGRADAPSDEQTKPNVQEEKEELPRCSVCHLEDGQVDYRAFTCAHLSHRECMDGWEQAVVASAQDPEAVAYREVLSFTCPACRCHERAPAA